MTTANVKLDPQRRGTEFKYISTLKDGWTAPMFTGGILFTIRRVIPGSEVPDDSDPDVLAQVSVAGGGIVFTNDTDFTVTIPGAVTKAWPAKQVFWDMQGSITAVPDNRVLDIAAGTVVVVGDITRSQ